MKRLLFGLAVAAVAAVVFTGCDDDGNTFTLDAYFDEVEGLVADYEEEQAEAVATLNGSEDLGELKDAFASVEDSLSTFLDGMNALAPPDEAADAHDDAVEAGEALLGAFEDTNEDVQAAESVDAFFATAQSDEILELTSAFNATCQPLQDVATDNDIDVDLKCPAP